MPRSTLAVSLFAVFLLGYLLGTGRVERSASAGPTDVSGNSSVLLATGADCDRATLWTIREGRVVQGLFYVRSGNSTNGVEELDVRRIVPNAVPGDAERPLTPEK